MARRIRHFKSKKAYKKFLAYIHIHRIKTRKPKYVIIAGRRHKIIHR
jgi:hypothetical protein